MMAPILGFFGFFRFFLTRVTREKATIPRVERRKVGESGGKWRRVGETSFFTFPYNNNSK